ncbi:MAG: epimerase [Pseudomonadota bacterium]
MTEPTKHPLNHTVLILGPTGRMGRNAARAFAAAGWDVRRFDRARDNLWDAAWGASVIVNCWHAAYTDWERDVPNYTKAVIDVARASGATVILPGNLYVYGEGSPETLTPDTPHLATNPLGRVRVEMEAAYRASGVQTIVIRAGDFLDTEASGNWFDKIIAAKLDKGIVVYPGPLDVVHAYSFLPDVADTMVGLAERRKTLPSWTDVNAPSFAVTAQELAAALARVIGTPVRARRFAWWPVWLAQPVWPMARHLLEMRYLWAMPHRLDPSGHQALLPTFRPTPLDDALRQAIGRQRDVDPDQTMGSDAALSLSQ